jgi:nucleoid-associated protein YgaU
VQGRGLLTLATIISFSFLARAETAPNEQAPAATAPAAATPPAATPDPDPSTTLAPKTSNSTGNEITEFEEIGGEKPRPAAPPTEPATPPTNNAQQPPAAEVAPAPEVVPPPSQSVSPNASQSESGAPSEPATPAPPAETANPLAEPTPPPPPELLIPTEKIIGLPKMSEETPAKKAPRVSEAPRYSSSPKAIGVDEPDLQTEERLHRIYQNYNSRPTPEDSWGKAVGQGKAQVYKVQSGDTLWDVSQTLFGDSQFWPKIWSINNETVTNPHQITPETRIKFFPGGLQDAPSLAVTGAEPPPVVVAPPMAKNETPVPTATDAPVMPKPLRHSKVLKNIPPSLPLSRFGIVNKPRPKVEIVNARKPISSPLVYLSYYVNEGDLSSIGEVMEIEKGSDTASEFQYVILKLNNPGEKILHAVHESDKIKNPFTIFGSSGTMIESQGELEVLEKVSNDENYYRAMVRKAVAPIEVGAKLLAGPLPRIDVSTANPVPALEATLIGGQFSGQRVLYGKLSFVFIDGGTAGGLQEGQSVNVYANLKTRNEKTIVRNHNRLIGTVKIVKVTTNFSTGYVTDSFEDLQIGDHIGGSSTVAPAESKDSEAQKASDKGSSDSSATSSGDQLDL